MEQKQNAPEYGKNLGLSIFQMICCCQVTGLIALVVTLIANSDYRTGKMDDYEKKMKNADYWSYYNDNYDCFTGNCDFV